MLASLLPLLLIPLSLVLAWMSAPALSSAMSRLRWSAEFGFCSAQMSDNSKRVLIDFRFTEREETPNDPSSATAATRRVDCNRDGLPPFAAAHG